MAAIGGINVEIMKKTVYTHSEDWLSDAKGNTTNFANTYCNSGDDIYIVSIEENTATGNYKAVSVTQVKSGTLNNVNAPVANIFRRADGTKGLGTNVSYYVSQGAKITVYSTTFSALEGL